MAKWHVVKSSKEHRDVIRGPFDSAKAAEIAMRETPPIPGYRLYVARQV